MSNEFNDDAAGKPGSASQTPRETKLLLTELVAKSSGRRLLLLYASNRHSTDRPNADGISSLLQTVRAPLQPWFKYSTGLNLAQASTVLSLADTCSGKPVINIIFSHAYDT
jgi:hypothetical protein